MLVMLVSSVTLVSTTVSPTATEGTDSAWKKLLRQKLDRIVSVNLVDYSLHDFLVMTHNLSGATVICNPGAMASAHSTRFSFMATDVPISQLLDRAMRLTDLRNELLDGAIYITQDPHNDGGRFARMEKSLAESSAAAESQSVDDETARAQLFRSRLARSVTFDVLQGPMEEIIDNIRQSTGLEIVVDPLAFKDRRTFTFKVQDLTAQQALHHLMRVADLRYRVEHPTIWIEPLPKKPEADTPQEPELPTPVEVTLQSGSRASARSHL
jgi:hypothetical protein